MVDSLLEAKLQAGETLDSIQEKDREIAKPEDLLSFKNKLLRKDGKYYESDNDGNLMGEPYCPKCREVEKLAVHLSHIEELRYVCPNCSNVFVPRPKSWERYSTSYTY